MNRQNLQRLILAGLLLGVVTLVMGRWGSVLSRAMNQGKKWTVAERVAQYGAAARARLAPDCDRLGLAWPPRSVILAGFKQERRLEVWVSADGERYWRLKTYPILGASGSLGPKLREGDRQVPEGVYRVESLNPNSLYHLALRLDYPNAFDCEMGRRDGRERLGGDIMIHGGHLSIGCLAMGNEAIEELFVLAAATGADHVSVVLSPCDLRTGEAPDVPGAPAWTAELYAQIRQELARLEEPAAASNTVALCAPAAAPPMKEGKKMDDTVEIYSLTEKKLVRVPRIIRTDAEWKALLPPDVYRVTRQGGTECAFTGKLYKNKFEGVYHCVCCGTELFVTDAKFESGTGWPSFFQPVHPNNVRTIEDRSYGMVRTEVRCGRCDAHLGHVFDDGPPPTGRRYCINSAALRFVAYGRKP